MPSHFSPADAREYRQHIARLNKTALLDLAVDLRGQVVDMQFIAESHREAERKMTEDRNRWRDRFDRFLTTLSTLSRR